MLIDDSQDKRSHRSLLRPRLWLISELYAPEETSTGYVLTRIAEALAGDFDVNVLCGQPTYSARGVRAPVRQVRNDVKVRRCFGTTLDKNREWGRLVNSATLAGSVFLNAIRLVRRHDIVLVVTNPPILPFLAVIVARLRRARPVLLVHDVYPDVMVATGMIRHGSFLESVGSALNRWLYRSVERVIVLGRDMAERVRRKLPERAWSRVTIIPNWADVELITPRPRRSNPLLLQLELADHFVVQYAGNMGRPNDLNVLVEAADRLRNDSGIRFLFLGAGTRRASLESSIRTRRLANVVLLPQRPRSEQPVFLTACDVAVVSLVAGMQGVGVPSRLYNILAAGRPVIVISDHEAEPAILVQEVGAGWIVRPGDVDGLLSAIGEARNDPERLEELGRRARRAAEERFSFHRIIDDYRQLFQSVHATDETITGLR